MRTTHISLLLLLSSCLLESSFAQIPSKRIALHNGWMLQSSCKAKDDGATVSRPGYRTTGWYKATVPTTVLAAQVVAGEFPDPYSGMNLRNVPGMAYEIGEQFAHKVIPPGSSYACSWWYRTEFSSPHSQHNVSLHFDGINNRANIWLNGKKIAEAKDVAGAYRTYEFNVSQNLVRKGVNVLAVEVFAQTQTDLGINWVDWNPTPPDKDLGLWQDVYLNTTNGPVAIRYPTVVTHLPAGETSRPELSILAELRNFSDKQVEGVFVAEIAGLGVRVKQPVVLVAGETKSVTFASDKFSDLVVRNAKLWWPAQMGKPNLYQLRTSFLIGGVLSDSQSTRVGIREITSEITDKGARLFRVNGNPILIRGGGWAPDMLLRRDTNRLRTEFEYVQDMNLNTIRLEGKIEGDEFFNLADEKGILIMAGWCCCDLWEEWDKWGGDQLTVATASLRGQSLRLRSHPSLLVWLNGSDGPPPAEVEKAYLDVLKETQWPNPILSSASQAPAKFSGPSGVKMTGPYDYVPPMYWLTDQKYGGAYGFNTETSPGPAVPLANSLVKFIPADHLWPMDDVWDFHAGSGKFQNLNIYNAALNGMYGEPADLADYERKSQAMAYDGERAMFEAYSRNKYSSTGVIQWMLNNAWPSLIWHLYDYYLQPAGGYFGTKKANESVHIQYSYDDQTVVVVNSTYHPVRGLKASVRVTDDKLKEMFVQEKPVDVGADAVKTVFTLPNLSGDARIHFVKLILRDGIGTPLSNNFYWLSAKQPELDWAKTTHVSTPIATYEDLTTLASLPKVRLKFSANLLSGPDGDVVRVFLKNPTNELAFQVRLAVSGKDGAEILPVLWGDNYISLMPGEERKIDARFPARHLGGQTSLSVSGWNIDPGKVIIQSWPKKKAD